MLVDYEAGLERVKQEQQFKTDTGPWVGCPADIGLVDRVGGDLENGRRDLRDEMLIEAAVTAGCHTIIVRDQDLTVLAKPFGIDLYTPRAWLGALTRPQRRRLH